MLKRPRCPKCSQDLPDKPLPPGAQLQRPRKLSHEELAKKVFLLPHQVEQLIGASGLPNGPEATRLATELLESFAVKAAALLKYEELEMLDMVSSSVAGKALMSKLPDISEALESVVWEWKKRLEAAKKDQGNENEAAVPGDPIGWARESKPT